MIQELIYDFDGTLSDTYPVLTNVLLEILREHGIEEDYERAYANFKISVGYTLQKYDIGLDIKEFTDLLLMRYRKVASTVLRPFPEAKQLLVDAVKAGKRNFIYTHSGKSVYEHLDKWGLSSYITFVLDSTYNFPNKPDPSALLYLIERFNIDPTTAVMVGDREIDVQAGQNAGIAGCLFDSEGFYPDCRAEYSVKNLAEIRKILNNFPKNT